MPEQARILIVSGDAVASQAIGERLNKRGHRTAIARDAPQALRLIDEAARDTDPSQRVGVVLADLDTAEVSGGLALLGSLRERHDDIVPIVMTGFGKVESAVRAIRLGAADYLLKPLVDAELLAALERAVQLHLLLARPAEEPEPPAPPETAAPSADEPGDAGDTGAPGWTPMPLAEAMKEPERQILLAALEANGWNRQQTAQQLDINRTTLYKKIRQYRLDEPG